jgi:hypothetical protein
LDLLYKIIHKIKVIFSERILSHNIIMNDLYRVESMVEYQVNIFSLYPPIIKCFRPRN